MRLTIRTSPINDQKICPIWFLMLDPLWSVVDSVHWISFINWGFTCNKNVSKKMFKLREQFKLQKSVLESRWEISTWRYGLDFMTDWNSKILGDTKCNELLYFIMLWPFWQDKKLWCCCTLTKNLSCGRLTTSRISVTNGTPNGAEIVRKGSKIFGVRHFHYVWSIVAVLTLKWIHEIVALAKHEVFMVKIVACSSIYDKFYRSKLFCAYPCTIASHYFHHTSCNLTSEGSISLSCNETFLHLYKKLILNGEFWMHFLSVFLMSDPIIFCNLVGLC